MKTIKKRGAEAGSGKKTLKRRRKLPENGQIKEEIFINDTIDYDDDDDEEMEDSEIMTGPNKDTMERLKEKDPDFYNFLQQNDQELLNFNDDDEDDILDEEGFDVEDDKDTIEKVKEEEKITIKTVKNWSKILQSQSTKSEDLGAIKGVIRAFRKTVNQSLDTSDNVSPDMMSMLTPSVFNAIINIVLVDLIPALMRFLRLQNVQNNNESVEILDKDDNKVNILTENHRLKRANFFDPRRSRNWKRIQSSLKMYLTDVLKMLDSLSADAKTSFERHILELTPFYNVFPHLIKRLIRKSIDEWSGLGGIEERNRVLAYLILHRTIQVIQSNDHLKTNEQQTMINQILRKLYLSYVGVARNTNESTIAQISFMKNSLVELYRLDDKLAYQHAFIFIRQLAINVRSSLILKEKNSIKTVYNWQFVHSVLLWSQLINTSHKQTDVLDALISPLVMVVTGTIKLLPTLKFIPLRFHLINALIKLSSETGHYIPVLRYFLDIYSLFDANKIQSKKSSNKGKKKCNNKELQSDKKSLKFKAKEINLDVMLKVSKEQTLQDDFIEKIFDKFYTLCLYYVSSQSASIAFPEMVTIFLHQSRKFVQSIRSPKQRTMMKQLIDKIQGNSNFIFKKRKLVKFSSLETVKINAWERQLKQSEQTPLAKFHGKFPLC
ncbi:hypothetical protein RDWZM_008604 [Blomia tropicalis]|uniref:Nucleolar complex protein 2 homolog n=1 Tax=Blomia tropicalis TaxID=40697 RepID=A0A9Q0M226_BLOTA|nr:hypothetical protein RDWZM_008604 [Blomia tropicalis]